MPFPTPDTRFPITMPDGSVHSGTVYLSAILTHPRIEAGDYSYASSHDPFSDGEDVARRIAPYLYEFSPERLVIGKFCQIAHGAQFITSSANHRFDGISSYPFLSFDRPFRPERPSMPEPGPDTIIGHDVWIGTGAMTLPGVTIGDGAIIGAGAIVACDVPPYTIWAGNPARLVRRRFEPQVADRLRKVAWWDWPIDHILAHEAEICGGDVAALEAARPL